MAIGGYFELELNDGCEYHPKAIHLNTGTNAFEYILRAKGYAGVYLPYYICDSLLRPIEKLGLSYKFYHIDESLEPVIKDLDLKKDQAFIYINYFGLKDQYIDKLCKQILGLIIDNAQSFFSRPVETAATFYSARKFFGVPDGAYLYIDTMLNEFLEVDHSHTRLNHLIRRIEYSPEDGYPFYLENEKSFDNLPIRRMSNFTFRLLKNIDYLRIAQKRRDNYLYLEEELGAYNKLKFLLDDSQVPMVYPFMTDMEGIRDKLIQKRVFVAQYWKNVNRWSEENSFEFRLAKNLIPLPIDQRYTYKDMKRIIYLIKEAIK